MNKDHQDHAAAPMERSRPADKSHESNVMDMRAVWLCLLVLLVLLVGAPPVVSALLRAYTQDTQLPAESRLRRFDPGSARHWDNPEADLAALREREDQHLTEYTWLDQAEKKVRIPIERAMELLVQRSGRPPLDQVPEKTQDTRQQSGDSHGHPF